MKSRSRGRYAFSPIAGVLAGRMVLPLRPGSGRRSLIAQLASVAKTG